MSLAFVARIAGNIHLWRRLAAFACAALLCTSTAWADGISGTVGGPVGLWVNTNDEALYISTSGFVGIGTLSPSSALDISSSAAGNAPFLIIENTSGETSNTNFGPSIILDNHVASTNPFIISETEGASGGSSFVIADENSPYTSYLVITQSGNVGIGTATPQSLLHIASGSTPVLIVQNTSTSGYSQISLGDTTNMNEGQIFLNGASQTGYGGANSLNLATVGAYPIAFETNSASTPQMIIASGGNVGIGTTTVGSLLTVNGTTSLGGTTTITGTLNQTGNAVLSGTTTFTGAINATGLSSGSIASGKDRGLNSGN
jgi:hypothetical protein